ncbi:MAG: ankyrin repeat domain-containing protein [Treponema sp.]|jgi:hypothetical protein|nr:ankyrin repeat domain-containing protein [Treponema sp.]
MKKIFFGFVGIFILITAVISIIVVNKNKDNYQKNDNESYLTNNTPETSFPEIFSFKTPSTDNMYEFLMGIWYKTYQYQNGSSLTNVKWHFDNIYRSEYVSFTSPAKFEYGVHEVANVLYLYGEWEVDNLTLILYLPSMRSTQFISDVTYIETWEIEIIDSNHIILKTPEWTHQYTRDMSVLQNIINNDNVEALRQYLQQGNNIDERLIFDLTPLMYAISKRSVKTALFLIEQGADLYLESASGYTPFHYAVMNSIYEDNILLSILEKGARVQSRRAINKSM